MKHLYRALLLAFAAPAGLQAAETKDRPVPAAATSFQASSSDTTCVVSDEKLGEMGEPYDYVYKQEGRPDRTVHLCCERCVPKFKKDPAKYLSKLDEAAAAKKKS